jgi:23S rRNA pseudouridine955/2504/2580 synthase
MIKSYTVDETCNDMRLDRWIRNTLSNIPQSLVEKNLRAGKIKVNNKKVKSSFKIKAGFEIQTFNLNFKENISQKKIKYQPTDQVIKENENLIIDDNENFIVLNKNSGISVQGGTKSKKIWLIFLLKVKFLKTQNHIRYTD